MTSTERHKLGWALGVSLTLHALVLWQTLSETGSGAAAVATARPAARLGAKLQRTPSTTGASHDNPAPRPLAAPPLQPALMQAKPRPSMALASSAAGTPSTPSRPQPTAGELATAPNDEATLDADGLRHYRISLAVNARRFRQIPPEALAANLRGTAEVLLPISPAGLAQPPQLANSSGHPLLDAAALEMIERAAQTTFLPASLRGRAFNVKLPVEFTGSGE